MQTTEHDTMTVADFFTYLLEREASRELAVALADAFVERAVRAMPVEAIPAFAMA